jgi:hypothetical protein
LGGKYLRRKKEEQGEGGGLLQADTGAGAHDGKILFPEYL